MAAVLRSNGSFKSYILPAIALAAIDAALVARLTRGSMLEVMRADYVRTATAKGLRKRTVIFKHVLRNSIIPVVTYLGISFGTLLGGALITENVFALDGIGNALVRAIQRNDNPIIMGVVTYGVLVFVLVNLRGRPALRCTRPSGEVGVMAVRLVDAPAFAGRPGRR